MDPRCKLQNKAPLLERIDLKGEKYWDFLIEDASNLAEANIQVFEKWSDEHQFFRFLKDIANVRFLSLVPYTFWSVCPPNAKFSAFHNLVRLDVHCCCEYWHGLMAFLVYSYNLEELVHRNVALHERKCDQAVGGSVPKCASMRLKSPNFRNMYTNHCYWTVLIYVLENAKFLNK